MQDRQVCSSAFTLSPLVVLASPPNNTQSDATCPKFKCTLQERGVRSSDGDGTVPVISTGLMCYKGWRTKRLNPANIPIVSREYVHQPSSAFKDMRYATMHFLPPAAV